MNASFPTRYGPWAVIAGASEGLGAAFASALAQRSINLVLLARRAEPLEALSRSLQQSHGIQVRTASCDLASADFPAQLERAIEGLEIGVAVYNAAYSPIGDFVETPIDQLLRAIDVNVRGPVCFARAIAPSMAARGRGALVLMSSLAGMQGSPRIATYAATKAFNRVLGESLWGELKGKGVDVITCCAGAIRTPTYLKSAKGDAPGTLDAPQVAEETLRALGRGPVVVPGALNKVASAVMSRVLPRALSVTIMAANTRGLT